MSPITPLGKPLSQNPMVGSHIPLSSPTQAAPAEPISAFQWVSLARAAWTWILRPIWYLCFKWPTKLLVPTVTAARSDERRREEEEWWDHRRRQERREE